MYRFALLGQPVSHSLSPSIHAEFAKQFQHEIQYDLVDIGADQLVSWFEEKAAQYKGLNITTPLKNHPLFQSMRQNKRHSYSGAVNVLFRQASGAWQADNTDGVGFQRALMQHNLPVAHQRILWLGSGAITPICLAYLMRFQPQSVCVGVRKMPPILPDWLHEFTTVKMMNIMDIKESFDGVIDATSAALNQQNLHLPKAWFHDKTWFWSLSYHPFLANIVAPIRQYNSISITDGVGMLVAQAAACYALWTGCDPEPNQFY